MVDVRNYLRLARSQASKIYKNIKQSKYDFEDIFQMCCLSLVNASKTFDEKRNIKFITYAYSRIYLDVIHQIREDKFYPCHRDKRMYMTMESLDNTFTCNKDSKEISFADKMLSDNYKGCNDVFNNILVKNALDKLPNEYRKIISLRYFKDRTQVEVARLLNTNQVAISRMEKKALAELKQYVS
jgi:RNA polymerase sporulation-specific sigma factor